MHVRSRFEILVINGPILITKLLARILVIKMGSFITKLAVKDFGYKRTHLYNQNGFDGTPADGTRNQDYNQTGLQLQTPFWL